MVKRFTWLLAAVAVFACAIPAMASASSVTTKAGVLAPVGTRLTATGNDYTQTSNLLGAITCSTLNVNLELTKNSGGTFEGSGSNTNPTQSGCLNGTKKLVYTTFNITSLVSTTSGSGTMSFTSKEDIGELTCTAIGKNVPFTYTPGTGVIKFSSAGGVTGSPSSCGTERIDAEFTLEVTGGSTVILD